MKAFWTLLSLVLSMGGSTHKAMADTMLLIGDSHTYGVFGQTLDQNFRQNDRFSSVDSFGSCGSSPQWWSTGHSTQCGYFERSRFTDYVVFKSLRHSTPLMHVMVEQFLPSVVVIEQGANQIALADNQEGLHQIEASSRRLAELAVSRGSTCIWVGSPNGRNKREPILSALYDAQRRGVEEICALIDSRTFMNYPQTGGDGRHFDSLGEKGREMARCWANHVTDQVISVIDLLKEGKTLSEINLLLVQVAQQNANICELN